MISTWTPLGMTASIASLRAFLEVSRSLSFTRAAETLHLTQSAVSKQVQMLEQHLGFPLFRRTRAALVLTPAGTAYLSHAAEALATLAEGEALAQELSGDKDSGWVVELSASPGFAAHWLVARLPEFLADYPGTRLRLRPRLPDFSPVTERFDLEIRLGAGRWPNARATYLLGREMALVASPALLKGRRIRSARDLTGLPLLQRAQRGYDWREWGAGGFTAFDATQGPELLFEGFSVLIPAVLAGCGLAICPLFMVLDQLRSGLLVRPLGECLPSRYAFHAVVPSGARSNPARDRLLDWMTTQADRTGRALEAYLQEAHSNPE
jgi:LysR family glycine cleavage system transcriptional activator